MDIPNFFMCQGHAKQWKTDNYKIEWLIVWFLAYCNLRQPKVRSRSHARRLANGNWWQVSCKFLWFLAAGEGKKVTDSAVWAVGCIEGLMDTVMNMTGFLSLIPDTFCRNEPSLSLLLSYATPWKHSCIFPNRDNLQNLTFYNLTGINPHLNPCS